MITPNGMHRCIKVFFEKICVLLLNFIRGIMGGMFPLVYL